MGLIRRNTHEEEGGVQMTSLMDLVFLLLIFFIVTASLKKPQKALKISMPTAAHAIDVRLQQEVVISVTSGGERYVHDGVKYNNQAPVSRSQLMAVMNEVAAKRSEGRNVVIRLDIDQSVQFTHIMDLLDNLHFLGLDVVYFRSYSPKADEHAVGGESG